MKNNLVSIITPLYNSELYIERTIQSVLDQTYENWELLIIDDCSTDGGYLLVEELTKKDSRIKLFKNEKNSGAGITRNNGISKAKGKYIAFLDSDDQWLPEKLKVQVHFMEVNNIDFSFTNYQQIDENGSLLKVIDNNIEKVDYYDMLKSNWIGCLTVMYNAESLGKNYMHVIRKRQDYTLWLKLLKKTDYAYCLPEVLAIYTVRNESISSNKSDLIKYNWRVLREIEGLSFLKSIYYLCNQILRKIF